MKRFNWFLRIGLLLVGVLFGVNHFIELPDFVFGLGLGTGIVLEMIGIYAINHDISKLRGCKKTAFSLFTKKGCPQ
jgi:hypothetical protein